MSKYAKMQAPPFWTWMLRIVGIACLLTLLTPTFYLIKYSVVDHPLEEKLALKTPATVDGLSAPAFAGGTEWYISNAENNTDVKLRTLALKRLGELASSVRTQIAFPIECLHAKLAIEQVASADSDPSLREVAKSTLIAVAEHGAVISR